MMNTPTNHVLNSRPTQHYCVWFICASANYLEDLPMESASSQDCIVVRATGETDATYVAHKLIRARYGPDFTITRVMGGPELKRIAYVLSEVDAGRIAPASEADEDLETWRLRYLEPEIPYSIEEPTD